MWLVIECDNDNWSMSAVETFTNFIIFTVSKKLYISVVVKKTVYTLLKVSEE